MSISKKVIIVFFLAATAALGQTTVQGIETCRSVGSNAEYCQGNYTVTAPPQTDTAAQFQQGYETGQNLGSGIARMRANHWVKKFCKKHPGQSWRYTNPAAGIDASGVCPL